MGPVQLPLGQAAVHEPPGVGDGVVDAERPAVTLDGGEGGAEAAAVQGQEQGEQADAQLDGVGVLQWNGEPLGQREDLALGQVQAHRVNALQDADLVGDFGLLHSRRQGQDVSLHALGPAVLDAPGDGDDLFDLRRLAQILPQVRLGPLPALDRLARQPPHVGQRAQPADAPARPQQAGIGELDARRARARVQHPLHQLGVALDQERDGVVRHLERRGLHPQPPCHVRARLAQGIGFSSGHQGHQSGVSRCHCRQAAGARLTVASRGLPRRWV